TEADEALPGTLPPEAGARPAPTQTSISGTNYTPRAGARPAPTDGMSSGTQRPSTSSPNNMFGTPAYGSPGNDMARLPEPLILPNQPTYNGPVEFSPTYQQRGTRPRSAVPYDQHESRFASIITILILLATLLLLGFSIFLAAELGFIHI